MGGAVDAKSDRTEGERKTTRKRGRERVKKRNEREGGCLTKDHGQEGHPDEQTESHLSEVGRPGVEVDLGVDLVDSGEGVHDDRRRLGSREDLVVDDEHVLMERGRKSGLV